MSSLCAFSKSTKEIYQENQESVLLLKITANKSLNGTAVNYGTAFVISDSGLVLTSAHLVGNYRKNPDYIQLFDARNIAYKVTEVVWSDDQADLALLKSNCLKIKALRLHPGPASIDVGEHLTIISNPSGFQNTLSEGTLSSKREKNGLTFLQYTAPISPGSSGGPIFDESGSVIAVVAGTFTGGKVQNINFGSLVSYLPKKYLPSTGEGKYNSQLNFAKAAEAEPLPNRVILQSLPAATLSQTKNQDPALWTDQVRFSKLKSEFRAALNDSKEVLRKLDTGISLENKSRLNALLQNLSELSKQLERTTSLVELAELNGHLNRLNLDLNLLKKQSQRTLQTQSFPGKVISTGEYFQSPYR